MTFGTLYGIGIGPGDPDLITLKGLKVISKCRHIFVPKSRKGSDSVALSIAGGHIHPDSKVHTVIFPMTRDKSQLALHWKESASQVVEVLRGGEDACFLTLGDALLYSTYIYLVRALRDVVPEAKIVTIPGITSFSAAAALTEFPIGESKQPVTIIPTIDSVEDVRSALETRGTVILMKIADRLPDIISLLEETGVIDDAVLVSRAGMEGERIVTDLRSLKGEGSGAGYLSIIIVHAGGGNGE